MRHDISDIQLLLGQDLSMVSLYFPSAPCIGREWFSPSAYSVVVHTIDSVPFLSVIVHDDSLSFRFDVRSDSFPLVLFCAYIYDL